MNRRQLITGLVSLVAAPAIVRAGSLMPVKRMIMVPRTVICNVWPPPDVRVGDLLKINGEGWWVRDMMDYGARLLLEEFA